MANDTSTNDTPNQSLQTVFQDLLGPLRTKEDLLNEIESSPELRILFHSLKSPFSEKFISYCTGSKGLPLTYDSVFKFIFNPETHPERLSRFLSLIIGKEVTVKRALPNEGARIIEEGSLLIMDIVVEFEDGALGNVEIQKIPYNFPGERATCYSSDLVLRQYSRVKKEKLKNFSYKDMKSIYTIVILEKSDTKFHELPNCFLHRSKQVFDTGLNLELLQEYFFISLDIFKEITQTIDTETEAWLYCLCSEEPTIIYQIIQKFPEFQDIYDDMIAYRCHIGEVLTMFSEALKLMDQNTVQLMIDEQIEQLAKLNEQLQEKEGELQEKKGELQEKEGELQEKEGELQEKEGELQEKKESCKKKKGSCKKKKESCKKKKGSCKKKKESCKKKKGSCKKKKESCGKKKESCGKKKESCGKKKESCGKKKESCGKKKVNFNKKMNCLNGKK